MFGLHSSIPSLLINLHAINTEQDAEDYISRLQKVEQVIGQLITGLKIRAAKGVVAPQFVFAHVIRDSENLLKGAPFDGASMTAPCWPTSKGRWLSCRCLLIKKQR